MRGLMRVTSRPQHILCNDFLTISSVSRTSSDCLCYQLTWKLHPPLLSVQAMADDSGPTCHPLRRPPFGNPATHAAHPLAFDPEFDISFRHPAYKDPSDIFMILPGLDHPQGGILHHHTALAACAIVANNRFEGWFTEDQEGKIPVNIPSDGILRKRDYYFHVTSDYKGI